MPDESKTGAVVPDPAAGGQTPPQPTPTPPGEGETVPVNVVQSIREELQQVKGQLAFTQDQLNLYRANVGRGQGEAEEPKPKEPDYFDGMEDDEVVTVADVKKLMTHRSEADRLAMTQFQVMFQYPDYREVVQNHLMNALQHADPALIAAIRDEKNPHRHAVAYFLAKTDPEYQKKLAESKLPGGETPPGETLPAGEVKPDEGQTIVDNLTKPGTAGPGGASGGLGMADYYANASRDDILKRMEEIKRRG